MDKLRVYLNSLAVPDQAAFAVRCGTTIGYLRKAISMGTHMGAALLLAIERESAGVVRCEDMLPTADWAVVRGKRAAANDSAPAPLTAGGA